MGHFSFFRPHISHNTSSNAKLGIQTMPFRISRIFSLKHLRCNELSKFTKIQGRSKKRGVKWDTSAGYVGQGSFNVMYYLKSLLYNILINDCFIEKKNRFTMSLNGAESRRGLVFHLLPRHLVSCVPYNPPKVSHLTSNGHFSEKCNCSHNFAKQFFLLPIYC